MADRLRAGILGYPMARTKAPRLYEHWLQRYGIDGSYEAIEVTADDFSAVLRDLVESGWRGASVTMPHKESALRLADEVTARARAIGSSNTLIFDDGHIIADNTDGLGFMKNLKASVGDKFNASEPALLIGAGGAGRAVLHALLEAGVPEIRLINRTARRAETLATRFGESVRVVDWGAAEAAMADVATIVNTTSLGMGDNPPLPFKLDNVGEQTVVADIVARPSVTPLITAATARGLAAVDGVGMLLHQAPPGFKAWYGIDPEVDEQVRELMLNS